MLRFSFVFTASVLLSANLAGADDLADSKCSRFDARPKLIQIGWPRAPHLGGRERSTSLAFAEVVSAKLGAAITPIELDRMSAKGDAIGSVITAIAKTGACPLAEGPIDDIAFSRDAVIVPSFGCLEHPDRRLPARALDLRQVQVAALDRVLDDGRIAIVRWSRPEFEMDSTIVARRYSPASDRCEWLVRMMNGPFCDETLAGTCEEGAKWIPRDDLAKMIHSAWEIR